MEVPSARILIVKVDVIVPEEVCAAVDAAVAKFGKLDVIIANAGTVNRWDKRNTTPMIVSTGNTF